MPFIYIANLCSLIMIEGSVLSTSLVEQSEAVISSSLELLLIIQAKGEACAFRSSVLGC